MSAFPDIVICLKSKLFEKASNLLKAHGTEIDERTTLKLLRSLVTQLKTNSSNKDEKSVKEFVQICCATLNDSKDLNVDDTEFTQGILSLYHLVVLYINSLEDSEIFVRLSKTILVCLRKITKSLKDVESIAANLFAQVWNNANKVSSELCFSYRNVALSVLVHGGTTYWNRVIDKMMFAVQESSNSSLQLAGYVFDEFLLYFNNHLVEGSHYETSLLQVWAQIVFLSSSVDQYEDCTFKLKLLAEEIQENKQVYSTIDLVLNLFGANNGDQVDMFSLNWNHFLNKHYQIILVRIVILALGYPNSSQSAEKKWERKNQIISVVSLLLYFYQEGDKLEPIIEANFQMDSTNLRHKCLFRACTISNHLLKLNPSEIAHCQLVMHHVDHCTQQLKDVDKNINLFSSAENFAYNVGAICFSQRSDYKNAVTFFRKALEYHVLYQPPEVSSEVHNSFSGRWTALNDSRKVSRDWNGIIDDFALCFSTFYDINETNGIAVCRNPANAQHLFVTWSRFKRDVHRDVKAPTNHIVETTVLDLLKLKNVMLESNCAWNLLFEEFQAFDKRKGWIPKVVFSAVARQACALAKTSFQKGFSNFLLSREGDNYLERYQAAKKAVTKLSAQVSKPDCQSQGQMYLALAYLELYVSQQEMLKKKTEEEMMQLGPLVQSSTNNEAPPGEDDTNVTRDGTSVDAVSYSYLKLESELKNQECLVKCLQQWEELVQFGWFPDHYSSVIFNCMKSLGYYFSLNGNSFFSARAWYLLLRFAESAKCDDELVLSASELLRLGLNIEAKILVRCHDLIENNAVALQEQILFLLNKAWSQYLQHHFAESWRMLQQVLTSPAMKSESPSKSILLLISQANSLRSLLVVVPEALSHIPPPTDIGCVQAGAKAAQMAYMALKCYVNYVQEQRGWDFYGQEWNVLRHFLVSAISLARVYLYTAAPREARFFLKEALTAAQRHVSVLRTAEALLELCNVDLMLDNTIDCQSKLVLICHLMGVAPPIVPHSVRASGGNKSFETPISPVQIKAVRRKGTAARRIPEVAIQGHRDATQPMLQLTFNHQGASPDTKAREIQDGIFPEHPTGCICLTCSSELVMSIRCAAQLVQSKLWSVMGFQELAAEGFDTGHQLAQSMYCRLRCSTQTALKSSSKRLFDVPDCLNINETWAIHKMQWFQPAVLTGMELLLENVMHRFVTHRDAAPVDSLAPLKAVMYEFYLGPVELRVIRLTSAMAVVSVQQPSRCSTPEEKCPADNDEGDNDIIILEENLAAKTPAWGLRKPLDVPVARRVRRNLMSTKIDDTITIDEDDVSDGCLSRRRLGLPVPYLSDSDSDGDSDILAPSPLPVAITNKVQDKSPAELTVQPVLKKYFKRAASKPKSNSQPVVARPKSSRKAITATKESDACGISEPRPVKCKSIGSEKESEVIELSSRLAVTKLGEECTETKDIRPKRTTRSTRK